MFIHVREHNIDVVRQSKCAVLQTNILTTAFAGSCVRVNLVYFGVTVRVYVARVCDTILEGFLGITFDNCDNAGM